MLEQVVSTTPSQASGNHGTELSTIGHVNSEWCWKGTFDYTQILNNYALKWAILYQRLKFVSQQIQFWKYFHSVLLCIVGSDYSKKSRVLYFLAKIFLPGCFRAFKDFATYGAWFALVTFFLRGASSFKVSKKNFQKMHNFNTLFSKICHKFLIEIFPTKIFEIPISYFFRFWFWKCCFQNR